MLKFHDPIELTSVPTHPLADATIRRGTIRAMHFSTNEQLLVLGGRGIDLYDPETLELSGRWLPEIYIEALHPIGGDEFVVVAIDGSSRSLYRVVLEGEIGEPFFTFDGPGFMTIGASKINVAIPHPSGATVFDYEQKETKTFEIDEALLEGRKISQVALTADGAFVIAYSGWRVLNAWSVETGEVVLELTSFDAPQDLTVSGDTLIYERRSSVNMVDLKKPNDPVSTQTPDGKFVHGAGRVVAIGRLGDHTEYQPDSNDFGETIGALEGHYGAMSAEGIGAVSQRFVATFAGSYGVLSVHSAAGEKRLSGFLSQPKSFSISDDANRIVIETEWRNEALLFDRADRSCRALSDSDGLLAPAISRDGSTLVVPIGNNLKPRQVVTVPFDGSADPEPGPKLLPFTRVTTTFGEDLYASNAYKLQKGGFLGVYRIGSSRALMKLKEADPRFYAISADGTRAAVVWRSADVALHDLTAKGKVLHRWGGFASAVAVTSSGRVAFLDRAEDVMRLNLCDGETKETIEIEVGVSVGSKVPQLIFGPDEETLYVGTCDGAIQSRDPKTGELRQTLSLHAGPIVQLAFAGSELWSLGTDGYLHGQKTSSKRVQTDTPDLGEGEIDLAPTTPWVAPAKLKLLEPKNRDAKSVEPFSTDWAKTPFPLFCDNLEASGFVRNDASEHATNAMDLYAPELGIAVVDIDEEHGCANVSFHAWDGTRSGAGEMALGDVDPTFYTFVFNAVRDAYSED